MTTIPASYDTLMDQASGTVATYLRQAATMLDDTFGKGYAEKHPELVGKLVEAMTRDFGSATFAKAVGELADVLANIRFHD